MCVYLVPEVLPLGGNFMLFFFFWSSSSFTFSGAWFTYLRVFACPFHSPKAMGGGDGDGDVIIIIRTIADDGGVGVGLGVRVGGVGKWSLFVYQLGIATEMNL